MFYELSTLDILSESNLPEGLVSSVVIGIINGIIIGIIIGIIAGRLGHCIFIVTGIDSTGTAGVQNSQQLFDLSCLLLQSGHVGGLQAGVSILYCTGGLDLGQILDLF